MGHSKHRPPTPIIAFRMSKAQNLAVRAAANERGESLSMFIRDALDVAIATDLREASKPF